MSANKKLSEKHNFVLFALLIILNLILRIPSIPHSKGSDSFVIQTFANSITYLGYAEWWQNGYAVFGLYPYSYASALPFLLSGISQLLGWTDLNMDYAVLVYSIVLGLLSIFTSYVLAGVLSKDFTFKFLLALLFSTAQGVMIFSTWESSARGPFIILLPLFIYILISTIDVYKKLVLLLGLWFFLAATHQFFFLLFPVVLVYIFHKVIFPRVLNIPILTKNKFSFPYIYLIIFLLMSSYPFFTGLFIVAGSRYDWIINIVVTHIRFIGPAVVFVLSGYLYLLFKENKQTPEWYLLSLGTIFTVFIYEHRYGVYFILIIAVFFMSISIRNLTNIAVIRKSKIGCLLLAIIIISSTMFTGFYNHYRTGGGLTLWYMTEKEYSAGVWANNLPENSIGIGDGVGFLRVSTVSRNLSAPRVDYSNIEVVELSYKDMRFYFDGPYVLKPHTSLSGSISWLLDLNSIDDTRAKNLIQRFNAEYFVQDIYYRTNVGQSLSSKSKLYENGRFGIWLI